MATVPAQINSVVSSDGRWQEFSAFFRHASEHAEFSSDWPQILDNSEDLGVDLKRLTINFPSEAQQLNIPEVASIYLQTVATIMSNDNGKTH